MVKAPAVFRVCSSRKEDLIFILPCYAALFGNKEKVSTLAFADGREPGSGKVNTGISRHLVCGLSLHDFGTHNLILIFIERETAGAAATAAGDVC